MRYIRNATAHDTNLGLVRTDDMRIEPEISSASVVLLGDFNPAIFTPAWFALHGLLPERVADSADLRGAHQQVTAFETDWLQLQVTVDRFFVGTSQAPYVRLCDLVMRTFKEYLYHTPLKAFGINRWVHFRVSDLAERDRIGRFLAPVEPWGEWAQKLDLSGKGGGMTSLKMSQLAPEGRPSGDQINVTVEPSARIAGGVGVYVQVNDHYSSDNAEVGSAEHLMKLLGDHFNMSLRLSDEIIDHIMSLAKAKEK